MQIKSYHGLLNVFHMMSFPATKTDLAAVVEMDYQKR